MKKIISVILSAIMMMSTVITVNAENETSSDSGTSSAQTKNDDSKLKQAILTAKSRVTIPKRFSKFEYDESTSYGTTCYTLQWSCVGKKKTDIDDSEFTIANYSNNYDSYERFESIYVVIQNDNILCYDYYDSNYYTSGKRRFAKLSVDTQQDYAKKYQKQLNPDTKGNPIITRDTSDIDLSSNVVSYTISRENSDIKFVDNYGIIIIDRDTGTLLSYNFNWWNDAVFPDASKAITEAQVNEIYKEQRGLWAYYEIAYDYEKKEYKPFIIYAPLKSAETEIDALTGTYTKMYEDIEHYEKTDSYDWSGYYYDDESGAPNECAGAAQEEDEVVDEDGNSSLSKAELEALEKEDTLISKSEATKIIKKDKYIVINDNLIQSGAYLTTYYDDKDEEHYCWQLSYEYSSDSNKIYLSVRMDAETGKILYFGKSYSKHSVKKIDTDKGKLIADKVGTYYIGNKFSEYKFEHCEYPYQSNNEAYFKYTRYVNNIPVPEDTVSIKVNSSGEVLGFSYTYHDITFPDAKILSVDEAYKKLFEKMKPSLYYTGFIDLQLKSHIYLTYYLDEDYYIDAKTGERIDGYGTPYYSDYSNDSAKVKKEIKYTDIKGHWAEKYINTLLDYNIYISEESKLRPDNAITLGEFCNIVSYLYDTDLKRSLASAEGVSVEKYNFGKTLTQADLAKCFVIMYSDFSGAAEIPGIFLSPYPDVTNDSEYCGYIAIGLSEGYLTTKKGETFNPSKTITKAEVLKIAYDYFSSEKDQELYELFKI